VKYWRAYNESLHDTNTLLEPLRGTAFKTIWLSYPRGAGAWESATDLLSSSRLPKPDILQSIDPFSAADELFSHIFFEKYLELYYPNHSPEDFVAMSKRSAESPNRRTDVDWAQLYQYCDECFAAHDLAQLLTTAYMFRLPLLLDLDALLLSNERMVIFLASLPVDSAEPDTKRTETVKRTDDPLDSVAWEFFRQLVSPMVDPVDETRVRKLAKMVRGKTEEIRRLKTRCLALAHELGAEPDLEALQDKIRNHIRVSVQKDVQAVLELDKRAVGDLVHRTISSLYYDRSSFAIAEAAVDGRLDMPWSPR
jgi:hypothetical protein